MKRFLWLLVLAFIGVGLVAAQTATVTRNVNLRPDPSTNNDPVTRLEPHTQLQLIEPHQTAGFLYVKTNDGQEGWVWAKNVTLSQVMPQANGGDSETAPANAISSDWERPDPQSSVFHGQEGDCGEAGDGGDTDTNLRKNRIDIPSSYHSVTWDAINNTPFPQGAPRSRADWSEAQLAQIKPFEGSAITVEGFLFKVKVEKTSPNVADDVDWHTPLTSHSSDGEDLAIVVETTPRIRGQHPNWTTNNLKP